MTTALASGATLTMLTPDRYLIDFVVISEVEPDVFEIIGVYR